MFVPSGNTGLGPEKTSFFQALSITTKISRGTIEILVCVQWGVLCNRPVCIRTNPIFMCVCIRKVSLTILLKSTSTY